MRHELRVLAVGLGLLLVGACSSPDDPAATPSREVGARALAEQLNSEDPTRSVDYFESQLGHLARACDLEPAEVVEIAYSAAADLEAAGVDAGATEVLRAVQVLGGGSHSCAETAAGYVRIAIAACGEECPPGP